MRIAIIGAGPIGLEAATQAQAAGHEVVVFESGHEPAWSVARWGHVRLFTPWHMNTSPEGRAALGHAEGLSGDDFPTGAELRAHYLLPLAKRLDVRCRHRLIGASRSHLGKGALLGSASRTAEPFRLLLATDGAAEDGAATTGGDTTEHADVLLDCSGTFGDPAPAGPGGLPLPGELALRALGLLRHGPAPVHDLTGKRVILVGDGASATTVLQALLSLPSPARVTWLTPTAQVPAFHSAEDDVLPGRRALWEFGRDAVDRVDHRPGGWLTRFDRSSGGLQATLESGETIDADVGVIPTGFRPDNRPLRELQYHACWGSEGPMKLAAGLLATRGGGGGDCLVGGEGLSADSLRSPEPRLFVLGSKSFGRRGDFLLQTGHQQVRDVLGLLAEE